MPSNKYLDLVGKICRKQSAILTQLRTGHSPLNHHLFRIRCAESPVCSHCPGLVVETVRHFLLQCPRYQQERRKLKRAANLMTFLLSNPKAVNPLMAFIIAFKRFENLK